MKNSKNTSASLYHLFRYQILPLKEDFQLLLPFDNSEILGDIQIINDLTSLISVKNQLFMESLRGIRSFYYNGKKLSHQIEYCENDICIIRLGNLKKVKLRDPQFRIKIHEDWPSIRIILNNDPETQIAAIEIKNQVFSSTNIVSEILGENLTRYLRKYNLGVYFEPIFDEEKFWDVVKRYPKSITQVKFELVSPNLAAISKNLKVDLKQLKINNNVQKSTLQFDGPKDSYLRLVEGNSLINNLVEYASAGGGNVSIKVGKMKKTIQMKDKVKEITMENIQVDLINQNEVVTAVKKLLS